MLQFVALSTLLVVANAGLLPAINHAAPVAYAAAPLHNIEHHAPAQYDFKYSVHDPHTNDIKEQQESRHGDNVEGHYSLVEPDGGRRTVHYSADAHNGFNAVVQRDHATHYSAPVAHAAPIAHHAIAAPIVRHAVAAPIVHQAPIAYTQHAQPITVAHSAPIAYTQHHQAQPVAIAHSAPIAYTQQHQAQPIAVTHSAPIAYTQHHQAQPVAIAHSAPIAYTQQHQAQPVAFAHSAPIAYTQHHQAQPVAIAHSAPITYTQHAAPLAYAAPLSHHHQLAESRATITHHGNQHHAY